MELVVSPDWKSEDRKIFPPKKDLSCWVTSFELMSFSCGFYFPYSSERDTKKNTCFFFFSENLGAKLNRIWFNFPGILSGLSCWNLLPTFWPWSTSMSLGSWNIPSGSGQIYSDLTSMAQRFRKGNSPRLNISKKHLGWWNMIPFGQIWMFLENPLWREKSGVCFLEKKTDWTVQINYILGRYGIRYKLAFTVYPNHF